MSELRQKAFTGVRWTSLKTAIIAGGSVLLLLVLVRYLSKEDFGLFAIANITFFLLAYLSDLGLSEAIIHKQDIPKKHLDSLYWINLLTGFALFIAILGLRYPIAAFYGSEELVPILFWTGLNLFVLTCGQQFQALLQKHLHFDALALAQIGGFLVYAVLAVVMAIKGLGVWSLVYAEVAKIFVTAILYIVQGWVIHRPKFILRRKGLGPYLRYGRFQVGQSVLEYAGNQLDSLIVGKVLGTSVLGAYDVLKRIVSKPVSLAGPMIGEVAFPMMAIKQAERDTLRRYYLKALRYIHLLAFPLYGLGFVLARPLIELFLGVDWLEYVWLLRVLIIYFMLRAYQFPTRNLLQATGQMRAIFWWQLIVVLGIPVVVWLGLQFDLEAMVLGLAIWMVVVLLGLFTRVLHRQLGGRAGDFIRTYGQPLGLTLFGAITAGILQWIFIDQSLWAIIAGTFGFLAMYILLLSTREKEFMADLLQLIGVNRK